MNYQQGCIMHLLLGLEAGNRIYSCGFWYTSYILAWKEAHLSVFLLGSEWLIKISGFLTGLKKKNSLAHSDKVPLLFSLSSEKKIYTKSFFPPLLIYSLPNHDFILFRN